jgi:hypothetical protein
MAGFCLTPPDKEPNAGEWFLTESAGDVFVTA